MLGLAQWVGDAVNALVVAAAVFGAFAADRRLFAKRPDLDIELQGPGNRPYWHVIPLHPHPVYFADHVFFFRVWVRNTGDAPVLRCRLKVRIVREADETGNPAGPDAPVDFPAPVTLLYSALWDPSGPSFRPPHLDEQVTAIEAGDREAFDILYSWPGNERPLCSPYFYAYPLLPGRQYRIELTVHADAAVSCNRTVRFRWSGAITAEALTEAIEWYPQTTPGGDANPGGVFGRFSRATRGFASRLRRSHREAKARSKARQS